MRFCLVNDWSGFQDQGGANWRLFFFCVSGTFWKPLSHIYISHVYPLASDKFQAPVAAFSTLWGWGVWGVCASFLPLLPCFCETNQELIICVTSVSVSQWIHRGPQQTNHQPYMTTRVRARTHTHMWPHKLFLLEIRIHSNDSPWFWPAVDVCLRSDTWPGQQDVTQVKWGWFVLLHLKKPNLEMVL